MSETHSVDLIVDDVAIELRVDDLELLVDSLRDRLGISNVREACGEQICGSCTVLLDGKPASSCGLLTIQADNRSVSTVEGLAESELGAIVVDAFVRNHAFQCGFCIPGFVVTTVAALARNANASVDEVLDLLDGNLCRCGSYPRIRLAVEDIFERRSTK